MLNSNELFKPVGIYPAMATPFHDNGKVNEKELRRMVNWYIERKVHGLFPMGSTGEFVHLGIEEKAGVMRIVKDEAAGRVPVIPGITDSCYARCIELAHIARDMGCSAALVAPPYYYTLPQEMIEAHFEEIARTLPDLPLVLYNIPLFATPIDYNVIQRLSRYKNIVAMKDSSGSMVDLQHFMDKIRIAGEELHILIGRDEMFYPSLVVGARGVMSGCSSIAPEIMVEIYEAFHSKDHERALTVQRSILEILRTIFAVPFPLGVKMALECRGFNLGPARQKLSSAEQYNYFKVESRMYKNLNKLLGDQLVVD